MARSSLSQDEQRQLLVAVYELIQQQAYQDAMPLLEVLLDDDPNNAPALNFSGYIALLMKNDTVAYQYLKRALQEEPQRASVWANFGLAAQHLGLMDEALAACMKSIQLDPNYALGFANASSALVNMSRWDEAEKAAIMALQVNPDEPNAIKNLAHVYLAKHDWQKGWAHWALSIGSESRKEWAYGDEQRWQGEKGKAVVVYGEQGLGDEIFFGSCIPDAINDCKKVIVDCDPKLEGLFKRSFPKADVHGTRRDDAPSWLESARIDARCSIAQLPQFYRKRDEDFPGTPYLKADPEKVMMWQALWAKLGKKVVGICSEGGAKYTNKRGRKIPVEAFESLFAKDYVFVSLDYRDGIEHPKLREYPAITQSNDYDDTAALIASLDCVVGVVTTAMHCANGLGIPTHVLVPEHHQWRYAGDYLWSKSATLYKQGKDEDWKSVIERVEI